MYGKAREWLAAGGAIPKSQQLYDDLVSIETARPRPDGVIQLRSKQDMKDDGLPSPDHADAFVLSFAYEVSKKVKVDETLTTRRSRRRAQQTTNEVFEPHED